MHDAMNRYMQLNVADIVQHVHARALILFVRMVYAALHALARPPARIG